MAGTMSGLIAVAPPKKGARPSAAARKKSPPAPGKGGGGRRVADGGEEPRVVPPAILAFRARIEAIMRARRMSRRVLSRELKRVVRESFPEAEGVRGLSSSSVGRWLDESANGPQLIFLMILARALDTTLDALLDPAVPPDRLPPPGAVARAHAGLSADESALIDVLRRAGMGVDAAFHRLLKPESDAPTAAQLDALADRVAERLRRGE